MALPTNTDLKNVQKRKKKTPIVATAIILWTTVIAFVFPFHLAHLRVKSRYAGLRCPMVLFVLNFSSTHSQSCAFSLDLYLSSSFLTYKVPYLFYHVKTRVALLAGWPDRFTSQLLATISFSLQVQLIKFQMTLI